MRATALSVRVQKVKQGMIIRFVARKLWECLYPIFHIIVGQDM